MYRSRSESGQAAVETALTMPLTLFVVLGSLQLFMLMQAKQMAQYSVYQAARMGSVSNGKCDVMTHAAILSFLPALRSFMGPTIPGTPGQQIATVFTQFKANNYGGFRGWSAAENVVWIVREKPNFVGINEREHFDNPLGFGAQPTRLELRAIYWTPLLIPFADWVFSHMALANLGIQNYTYVNPLSPSHNANWKKTNSGDAATWTMQSPIANELLARVLAKHYVYPIEVTYTMRMMSPVNYTDFATQNCPGTPGAL